MVHIKNNNNNNNSKMQSAFCICGSTSTDSTNPDRMEDAEPAVTEG